MTNRLPPGQLRAGARGADRDRPARDRAPLPRHLDGRYLRIGPNPLDDPGENYHWFLGDGMVHGVRIVDGRGEVVPQPLRALRRRRPRSASRSRARTGRSATSPPTPTCSSTPGSTLALVEAGSPPYELTEELDTVGPTDFDGTLRAVHLPAGYTAHPHEDPDTGELHAVSYNWLRGNRVDYTVLGTDGRIRTPVPSRGRRQPDDARLRADRELRRDLRPARAPSTCGTATRLDAPAMRVPGPADDVGRSSAATRCPSPSSPGSPAGRPAGRPDTLPYSWDPDYPARIGLLPRERRAADDVRWFEIDPCFVFHTLNAYEDGDTVVVDVVRHDRMFATVLNGPDEGPDVAGALHHRPARRQGPRGPFRRALPGVPADRRAAHRPAPPVRLLGRLRGGPAPGDAVLATTWCAGTSTSAPPRSGHARRASSASCRARRLAPRTTAC